MTTSSVLATDAYKFSMAQAGFPLRRETFYLSFRFGGLQCVPFDLAERVRRLLTGLVPTPEDRAFARAHGYGLTDAMEAALSQLDALEIQAVPAGMSVARDSRQASRRSRYSSAKVLICSRQGWVSR